MNELVTREISTNKLLFFPGRFWLICDGELAIPVECFVAPYAQFVDGMIASNCGGVPPV
jgi:hypothetical protein